MYAHLRFFILLWTVFVFLPYSIAQNTSFSGIGVTNRIYATGASTGFAGSTMITAVLDTRTGATPQTSDILWCGNNAIARSNFGSSVGKGNITLPTGGTCVKYGLWPDLKNQWDATAKRVIVCLANGNRTLWSVNLDNNATQLVYDSTATGDNPTNASTVACVIDFERNVAYVVFASKIARLGMTAPGGVWSRTAISTAISGRSFTGGGVLDTVNNKIYFLATSGGIFSVDRNEVGSTVTVTLNIFGGSGYRSMVLDETNKLMYLGNDIGLGFRAPLGNFKGSYQIFFVNGNVALDLAVVDPSTNVTYWGTSNNVFLRVNPDDFSNPYDQIYINCTALATPTCPTTANLGSAVMVNNTLWLGFRNSAVVFRLNLWTCANYTSCSACTADPYCGWCAGNNACVDRGNCSGAFINNVDMCPAITDMSPLRGSYYGSTVLTITGTVFTNSSKLQCSFFGTSGYAVRNVTYVNSTTVTCPTPPRSAISSTNDTLSVSITYAGAIYSDNSAYYTYYPCDGQLCSSCYSSSTSECGWCISSGNCAVASVCGANNFAQSSNGTCPGLVGVTPSQGVDAGGTNVTITGTFFHNQTKYSCKFGSNLSNATYINATTISCMSPAASVVGNSAVNLTVVYQNNNTQLYSETKLTFIYFNCGLSTSCTSCLLGQCFWCLEQQTCFGKEQSISCQDKFFNTTNCPVLSAVSPPSDYFNLNVNVTVVGNYFTNYTGTFSCSFSDFNTTVVPAVRKNNTAITCTAPGTSASINTAVQVLYNGNLYASNSANFFRYDCDGTECGNCATSTRPLCQWCVSDVDCISTSASCSNNEAALSSTCPALLSINPSKSHARGGILAYISVAGTLPNSTVYECDFGGNTTSGTWVNATTVSCIVPNTTTTGWVNVSLYYNGVRYSPDQLPFRYYVCSEFNGNCSRCLRHVEDGCSWCLPLSCEDTALNCPINAQSNGVCPSITDISPLYVPANSNYNVTVTGGKFIAASNYSCQVLTANGTFFNTSASWESDTTVVCLLPPRSIGVVSATLLFNSYQYTNNSDSFEFYDCNYGQSSSNCTSCAANPSDNCGWCLGTQTCNTLSECDPVNLSTSEWKNAVCPAISTISPNYTAIDGQVSLYVAGSDFRNNVSYLCQFNTFTTSAVYVNSTTLSCTAPSLATINSKKSSPLKKQTTTVTNVAVSVLYSSTHVAYTANSFNFQYLDCNNGLSSSPTCGDCLTNEDGRCAWCSVDNKCSTSNKCNVTYPVIQEDAPQFYTSCPAVTSISPLVGPTTGGTVVHIFGTVFFNDTNFACSFQNQVVNATYVNSTVLKCTAPSFKYASIVQLTILFKGREYSPAVDFQFQAPVEDKSSDPTLAIALGTVFGLLAVGGVLAAVAFFIILKRKTAKVKLNEPDFSSLAFAGALPDYESKPEECWDEFERILMENRFPLVSAICDTVQITDLDLVTRAIVYVGEASGTILPITKMVVTKEVAVNDTEGMMFRTNSVAVKLITHMAKMVGLPYLWRTLALSIHELNDIGKGETMSKYDTKSVQMASIMVPTSIEVDPSRLDDTADAAVNQLQLMLICQKLFTAITKSSESLPLQLRDIYRHIKIEVAVKYPEFGHKAVASFLFLRLICPCILAPHVYGLLDEPPNQECQRYLILLSKILQNLASGTLPGKKEDFLQKMNDFIASNQDALKELIDNITVQVDTKNVEQVELPKGLKQKSLEYLYDFVYTNWNAIESVLDNQNNNDNSSNVKTRMENLLDKMGPPEKKS